MMHATSERTNIRYFGWVDTCWTYYIKLCEQQTNLYREMVILRLSDNLSTGAGVVWLSQHSILK